MSEVPERLPDNLAVLYDAFGQEAIDGILAGESFEVDGVQFVSKYSPGSRPDRFFLVKPPGLVERYRQLCADFRGAGIVELGIAEGGSTALLALLARPRKLVAVDLEPEPLDALHSFVESRDLATSVSLHFGVDQADRARLAGIVDEQFADASVDLVIDDCSHMLGPTRSSFETLFPRLRPGGLFVIEDWNVDHLWREAIRASIQSTLADPDTPGHEELKAALRDDLKEIGSEGGERPAPALSRLAVELVLARACGADAIAEVVVDEYWVTVRRGEADLDPASFRLADLFTDHHGFLAGLSEERPDVESGAAAPTGGSAGSAGAGRR